ncbi:hypothetical protein D1007_32293 [Hordeum vulgare]|uniref:Uncharacterized protein n=1 Tax=Hordeum vulgare subsp. vulgare TaxID=112509 RepID=A0A8I6X142_HORVV|nr:hypothetical protein D1007_32293 [Hordeum vulgare]KAI5010482.1 hypothetical protein ZWY2020_012619 [Hordeum vulgare]
MSTRLAAVVRWCGGGARGERQRLRRRRSGRTVLLGGRRRSRLAVSRLVRWRLVAELLRPIRKALIEMAAGRRGLVALPLVSFPFVGALSLPAVVA